MIERLGERAPEDLFVQLRELPADGDAPVAQRLEEVRQRSAKPVGRLEGDERLRRIGKLAKEFPALGRSTGQEAEVVELTGGQARGGQGGGEGGGAG